jgi:glutamyl/glutaminyl-tRNA synthetase
VVYEADAVAKHLGTPDLAAHLTALVDRLAATAPFDEASVEAAVREVATARGIKAGPLIHAVRVAVTGRLASPGLFEVLVFLGQERTLTRLRALGAYLASRG